MSASNLSTNPFQANTTDPTMVAFGMLVLLITVFIGLIIIAELIA